jgi:hypothetical protein
MSVNKSWLCFLQVSIRETKASRRNRLIYGVLAELSVSITLDLLPTAKPKVRKIDGNEWDD